MYFYNFLDRSIHPHPQPQSKTQSPEFQSVNELAEEEPQPLTVERLQLIPDKVPVQKHSSVSSDMSSFKNDGTHSEKSDENIPSDDLNVQKPPINVMEHIPRRNPKLGQTIRTSSIDHYDHYKQAPSRDCSLDRYSRATSRLSSSRATSIDRSSNVPANNISQPSDKYARGSQTMLNPIVTTKIQHQQSISQIPPFEDILMKNRSLGQDILPSLGQPKRTESLYIKSTNSSKVSINTVF